MNRTVFCKRVTVMCLLVFIISCSKMGGTMNLSGVWKGKAIIKHKNGNQESFDLEMMMSHKENKIEAFQTVKAIESNDPAAKDLINQKFKCDGLVVDSKITLTSPGDMLSVCLFNIDGEMKNSSLIKGKCTPFVYKQGDTCEIEMER